MTFNVRYMVCMDIKLRSALANVCCLFMISSIWLFFSCLAYFIHFIAVLYVILSLFHHFSLLMFCFISYRPSILFTTASYHNIRQCTVYRRNNLVLATAFPSYLHYNVIFVVLYVASNFYLQLDAICCTLVPATVSIRWPTRNYLIFHHQFIFPTDFYSSQLLLSCHINDIFIWNTKVVCSDDNRLRASSHFLLTYVPYVAVPPIQVHVVAQLPLRTCSSGRHFKLLFVTFYVLSRRPVHFTTVPSYSVF